MSLAWIAVWAIRLASRLRAQGNVGRLMAVQLLIIVFPMAPGVSHLTCSTSPSSRAPIRSFKLKLSGPQS